jgi:hypothetical protein
MAAVLKLQLEDRKPVTNKASSMCSIFLLTKTAAQIRIGETLVKGGFNKTLILAQLPSLSSTPSRIANFESSSSFE